MSRVYATTDEGDRFLVFITCDADCEERIRPNPDIASSGWVKGGLYDFGSGMITEDDFCPDHDHMLRRYQ